jgi:hypothetical protein
MRLLLRIVARSNLNFISAEEYIMLFLIGSVLVLLSVLSLASTFTYLGVGGVIVGVALAVT